MRVIGWEKRLNAVVAKHQQLPSQYGVSDCYLIADDAVEAVIGEFMYPSARRYKTEQGAGKQLRKHGFSNVMEAFAAKFAAINPLQAQRGDIGVVEHGGVLSGGVFTSIGFMTRGTDAVVFIPAAAVKTAFKVI